MIRFPIKYLLGSKDPMMGKEEPLDLMDYVCLISLVSIVLVLIWPM